MTRRTNGRILGGLALLLVFGAGVLAGVAIGRRPERDGVTINVRATTELPRELRDLDLTAKQRDSLGTLLLRGRRSVTGILDELQPRMRATMDSLDREIHAVLTPEQRARLDAARKARGAANRRQDSSEVVVDTTGGKRPND